MDQVLSAIGSLVGYLPVWIALPIGLVVVICGWIAWQIWVDPFGLPQYEQWRERRRKEKEYAKK